MSGLPSPPLPAAASSSSAAPLAARTLPLASPRLPPHLPQAVIFDMDGLMLDTERLDRDLWQAAARRRGIEIPDALHASLVGRRIADAEQLLREHFGPSFPLAALRADVHEQWQRLLAVAGMPRKPGLDALLALLERARIPKAVATSTARAKALQSLGPLAQRFQAIACGDEVRQGKPAPDIFELAARRLGLAPALCLVLEDSPPGVAAARAAGMAVIMIPDLVAPAQPPQYLCDSLDQVTAWLQSLLAPPR